MRRSTLATIVFLSTCTAHAAAQPSPLGAPWEKQRLAGCLLEIPGNHAVLNFAAPEFEYRKSELVRQYPQTGKIFDSELLAENVVLVAVDRETMRSPFADYLALRKLTPEDWVPGTSDTREAIERFAEALKEQADENGELYQTSLVTWGDDKTAVHKETTRTERTPKGKYLRLVSFEHWFFVHPNLWHLSFNTVEERARGRRGDADHCVSTFAIDKDQPQPDPVAKLVPRTAGPVSMQVPETFEFISVTGPEAKTDCERVLADHPSAKSLIEQFAQAKRLAVGFDPKKVGESVPTTVSVSRYPLPQGDPNVMHSREYVQKYAAGVQEKWEQRGLRTDRMSLFPLGDEGPVYRFDYTKPATEPGEVTIVSRQFAYFLPPHVWVVTLSSETTKAAKLEKLASEIASSFVTFDAAAVAPAPDGASRE